MKMKTEIKRKQTVPATRETAWTCARKLRNGPMTYGWPTVAGTSADIPGLDDATFQKHAADAKRELPGLEGPGRHRDPIERKARIVQADVHLVIQTFHLGRVKLFVFRKEQEHRKIHRYLLETRKPPQNAST